MRIEEAAQAGSCWDAEPRVNWTPAYVQTRISEFQYKEITNLRPLRGTARERPSGTRIRHETTAEASADGGTGGGVLTLTSMPLPQQLQLIYHEAFPNFKNVSALLFR